jgi:hypothetical protein
MNPTATIDALRNALNAGTVWPKSILFAQSLVDQFMRKGKLSEKQWEWAVKLSAAPSAPTTVKVMSSTAVAAVLAFFAKANLKYPAMILSTPTDRRVRLYRAGANASEPGSVVVQGFALDDRIYLGRVSTDGTYKPSPKFDGQDDVFELLGELGADPVGVAAAYGKRTGCCSFCLRTLDDERSLSAGYGPSCAKKYGLPYPTKKSLKEAA